MKVIDLGKYSGSNLSMLESEISILSSVSHPHVLRLEDVYRTASHCYLVTEYCAQGDLLTYLTRHGPLCEKEALSIMGQLVQACQHLFQLNYLHRDIKPANVFRSHNRWVLGDFGFAMRAEGQVRTSQNVGTPLYMPLESLRLNLYSCESDIFAVGVILFELIVGVTPWESRSEKELVRKMQTLPFQVPSKHKHKLSPSLHFLLAKMCQPLREQRMTRDEFMHLTLANFTDLSQLNQITS